MRIVHDKKGLSDDSTAIGTTKTSSPTKEQARKPVDIVLVAELQKRNNEIEKRIAGVTAQLHILKTPFAKKIRKTLTD